MNSLTAMADGSVVESDAEFPKTRRKPKVRGGRVRLPELDEDAGNNMLVSQSARSSGHEGGEIDGPLRSRATQPEPTKLSRPPLVARHQSAPIEKTTKIPVDENTDAIGGLPPKPQSQPNSIHRSVTFDAGIDIDSAKKPPLAPQQVGKAPQQVGESQQTGEIAEVIRALQSLSSTYATSIHFQRMFEKGISSTEAYMKAHSDVTCVAEALRHKDCFDIRSEDLIELFLSSTEADSCRDEEEQEARQPETPKRAKPWEVRERYSHPTPRSSMHVPSDFSDYTRRVASETPRESMDISESRWAEAPVTHVTPDQVAVSVLTSEPPMPGHQQAALVPPKEEEYSPEAGVANRDLQYKSMIMSRVNEKYDRIIGRVKSNVSNKSGQRFNVERTTAIPKRLGIPDLASPRDQASCPTTWEQKSSSVFRGSPKAEPAGLEEESDSMMLKPPYTKLLSESTGSSSSFDDERKVKSVEKAVGLKEYSQLVKEKEVEFQTLKELFELQLKESKKGIEMRDDEIGKFETAMEQSEKAIRALKGTIQQIEEASTQKDKLIRKLEGRVAELEAQLVASREGVLKKEICHQQDVNMLNQSIIQLGEAVKEKETSIAMFESTTKTLEDDLSKTKDRLAASEAETAKVRQIVSEKDTVLEANEIALESTKSLLKGQMELYRKEISSSLQNTTSLMDRITKEKDDVIDSLNTKISMLQTSLDEAEVERMQSKAHYSIREDEQAKTINELTLLLSEKDRMVEGVRRELRSVHESKIDAEKDLADAIKDATAQAAEAERKASKARRRETARRSPHPLSRREYSPESSPSRHESRHRSRSRTRRVVLDPPSCQQYTDDVHEELYAGNSRYYFGLEDCEEPEFVSPSDEDDVYLLQR
mmetsp:Transcript_29685/g.67016  ORF Transcript_29685/g.67016 Transcript_29685/m.67016 type:complete len:878 (-) Transcript_29685:126-2759(-)